MTDRIVAALRRSRLAALTVFATYVVSSGTGVVMVHSGNGFALAERDRIVHKAVTQDKASVAYRAGDRASAIVSDFAGNVFYAAIPQTIAGIAVILPYVSVARQGWIGGIVSVDSAHRSRLRTIKGASYYCLVLILQFIPFSLAIGAGVRCGIELYRKNGSVGWHLSRIRAPQESLLDLGWVYAVAIPLFLVASAFEFLSPWNV